MLADAEVLCARTLDEALDVLAAPPGGGRPAILAGGTDLMVAMHGGTASPSSVLDIHLLDELRAIRLLPGGRLEIGALATFRDLGRSPLVAVHSALLACASRTVGAVQIQARATIGGNVANASPAGDSLPVLLAQGAQVVLRSRAGERVVDFDRFYAGYRQPDVRKDELITGFLLGALPAGVTCRFRKVGTRRAQAIGKVSLAAIGRLDAAGRIDVLRLAAGSVAPIPVRLGEAERAALGLRPSEAAPLAAAGAARDVVPIDDMRSTADYRREVTSRLVARFVGDLAAG